ncbi:MAG: chemotaxis protein CheD [Firmicutes bacterium]|nr:chemotaxis protein CheD [Bacillota bacterium]
MSHPEPLAKPEVIPVGLGELQVVRGTPAVLVCYGLGSCVGVAAFDPVVKVGGLVHVVLPDSNLGHNRDVRAKFADTAIPLLVEEMAKAGAQRNRLEIKVAGGAQMLALSSSLNRLDIGKRNAEAVQRAVAALGLRIGSTDLGGSYGRTMQLYLPAGRVTVSTIGRGEKNL